MRFPNSERPRDAVRCLDSTWLWRPVDAMFSALRGQLDLVTDRCGPPCPNSAYDFPQDQRGPFILRSALHQPTGSLNYTKSRNEVQRKKQVPWYGLRFWPYAQAHYILPSDINTWPSLKSGRSLERPGSIVQVNILFNQQYKTGTEPLQIKVVASLGSYCRGNSKREEAPGWVEDTLFHRAWPQLNLRFT